MFILLFGNNFFSSEISHIKANSKKLINFTSFCVRCVTVRIDSRSVPLKVTFIHFLQNKCAIANNEQRTTKKEKETEIWHTYKNPTSRE